MDFHAEHLVVKRKTPTDYILATLIIFAAVSISFFAFTFLKALSIIASIIITGVILGAWRLLQNLNIEYEYELTNQYLDIDKIMGKSRRKHLFSIDFHKIERCLPVSDSQFNNKNNIIKIYDFSGNPYAEGRIFVDFVPEGKTESIRIIFSPNDKMRELLKKSSPQKVML